MSFIFNFTDCPPAGLPNSEYYQLIDGNCYFYQKTTTQISFTAAQEDCASKFPNGGRLFEPQSLEIATRVQTETSNYGLQNQLFYIGVKSDLAMYSSKDHDLAGDYIFATSGVSVPYEISWMPGAPRNPTSFECVFARGDYWILI